MPNLRGNFRYLLAALCLLQFMLVASAHPADHEQELIYELRLDDLVLSTSIPIYERDGELFLPLGEVSDLLSLAIRYEGEGRASGYVMDESRILRIDALAGTVQTRDGQFSFPKSRIIVQQDDMFVARGLLSVLLPVNVNSDRAQQVIVLEPREKLPLQQLLERKARFENLKKAALDEDPSFPDITPRYRLLAPPVVDFSTSVDFSGRNLGHVSHRQSLIAAGDLAALSTTMNLASNNGTLDRVDFTAGRTDSKGELLGRLQATRFAIGAVQLPAFAGISRVSDPMYGFMVTNRPTTLPSQFASHDIEGPLPQGWDVELYYNGVPIGYQPPSKDTIYRFNNLPLKVGLNVFRIVLHGPNGETRVEQQRFLLDGLMVQPGKVQYTLGANREIIKGHQAATAIVAVDFGLGKSVSGFAGGLSLGNREGRFTHYADIGLKGTLGSTFLTLDHVRSDTGGSATLLNLKGYSSGLYLSGGQTLLDRFSSDIFFDEPDPLVSQTFFKVEGSLPFQVRMPFGVESSLDLRKSGQAIPTFTGRISGEFGGIGVAEQVTARVEREQIAAFGTTQVGTYLKDFSLRGQVNYQLSPSVSATALQLAATRDVGDSYQVSGQVGHTPASGDYDFTVGVAKRVGVFGFLVNGGWSTSGNYSISSQISVSAGINPRSSRVVTDAFPMSAFGGAAILAYVDGNGNGKFDGGERTLEGVHFMINGSPTLGGTGTDGVLLIKQLPVGMPLDITLVSETIPEPFLVPVTAGYRTEPRPGVISSIDFSLVPSGEVDGLVQLRQGDELVPVAGVRISLVDAYGKTVARSESDQSGYFLFRKVRGGAYRVLLAEQEAERLSVVQGNVVELDMPLDGDMLGGNDLVITRTSMEPPQPATTASVPASVPEVPAPMAGPTIGPASAPESAAPAPPTLPGPETTTPPSLPVPAPTTAGGLQPQSRPQPEMAPAGQRVEPPRVEQIRKKAEAGDVSAQKALGWIYSSGKEVAVDKRTAVVWYFRAAEKGDVDAMLALGWIYLSGDGVNRDPVEAAYWYGRAAEQGNAMARKQLKKLRR